MTLDELLALLHRLASVPSEEEGITELDHGLQCAAQLAVARPGDVELQVAGLCHDIGHQFGPDDAHGRIGAGLLEPLLGERVAGLVEAHVTAKRYLVSVDPGYALSPVSVATLSLQGGPLRAAEAAAFERSGWFADALVLRRADEAAKVPGREVPGLDRWVTALRAVSP